MLRDIRSLFTRRGNCDYVYEEGNELKCDRGYLGTNMCVHDLWISG